MFIQVQYQVVQTHIYRFLILVSFIKPERALKLTRLVLRAHVENSKSPIR